MIVIVTGARMWTQYGRFSAVLEDCWKRSVADNEDFEVWHGAASRGADKMAAHWAYTYGVPTREFPANWKAGRGMGHVRNKQMVETALAQTISDDRTVEVHAFICGPSRGTRNCMAQARVAGLEVIEHIEADEEPDEATIREGYWHI